MAAESSWDSLWTNVHLATMADGAGYGVIEDGALATAGDRIAFVGPRAELPRLDGHVRRRDGGGCWLTPGLIDCHTHLVFGGDRSLEFEARLAGASYESIAQAGGGILGTVRATCLASEDALFAAARPRLEALAAEGVTTIEIKSGYGLDLEQELKMLRVARRLGAASGVAVVPTLLALHALPPQYREARADYVRAVIEDWLPRVVREGLAVAVDVFCERIAFTAAECASVLAAARALGLAVKVHADQLSDGGGAALAAQYGALSGEHLEYTSSEGVAALARAGTVAVLLPGAYLYLREPQAPPVAALRARAVPMAVATDCNPGSSPCTSLLAMLPLAAASFGLTPAEALAGVTREAARALGLAADCGTLTAGKRADFAGWRIGHPRELSYWLGRNPLALLVRGGRELALPGLAQAAQS